MQRTPLQVVVVRDAVDRNTDRYVEALRDAFEGYAGNGRVTSYLGDAIDLRIHVIDPPILSTPHFDVQGLLGAAKFTVVVKLDPHGGGGDTPELRELLGSLNVDLIEIELPEATTSGATQKRTQGQQEIEPSLHPVAVALAALERARATLESDLLETGGRKPLRFFVSHAKVDGIPMALSLIELMHRLRALSPTKGPLPTFYDVVDIPTGGDWRQALEDAAKRAILVVLRTEEYENRYWCRTEYLWAEEMGVPIVVVDLRSRQQSPGTVIPFESAPTIRVHDGNLLRVVLHAIASHLKLLRIQWIVDQTGGPIRALPRHPSILALSSAIRWLEKNCPGQRGTILYPNPSLPQSFVDAVEPMLAASDMVMMSVDDWSASQ